VRGRGRRDVVVEVKGEKKVQHAVRNWEREMFCIINQQQKHEQQQRTMDLRRKQGTKTVTCLTFLSFLSFLGSDEE
jgi:hypothetical protein